MEAVYRNAALNVAATAAPNGKFGLFYDRVPLELMPFKVEVAWCQSDERRSFVCRRVDQTRFEIDLAPLNCRAWVMQERLLSQRIAHYAEKMLYWECCETFANELYPKTLPASNVTMEYSDLQTFKRLLNPHHSIDNAPNHPIYVPKNQHGLLNAVEQTEDRADSILDAWRTFVTAYGKCQLTFEEDRLVALARVARHVAVKLNNELVAGLWRSRFIDELCWQTYIFDYDGRPPHIEPRKWIAPSWSRTSVDFPTFRTFFTGDLARKRATARLVELVVDANPSGSLNDGHVKLDCRLVPALLKIEQRETTWAGRMLFHEEVPTDFDAEVQLDKIHFADEESSLKEIHLLLLQMGVSRNDKTNVLVRLALIPSAKGAEAFERIGIFEGQYRTRNLKKSFSSILAAKHEEAADQIIKIV